MSRSAALRIAESPDYAPSLVRPSVRVKSAAERLDADVTQVRRLLGDGELEGHRIGKRGVRIFVDSIEAYQRRMALGEQAKTPKEKKKTAPKTAAHREAVAFLVTLNLVSKG